jgi:hypothetical protein
VSRIPAGAHYADVDSKDPLRKMRLKVTSTIVAYILDSVLSCYLKGAAGDSAS